jgi:predicted component of type VI protein secretion system
MQLKLVVIAGASKASEIAVTPPMTFGRSRDADLTLRHALISRKHCEIAEVNGQFVVRDLGSLNGTFIGGQRINEAPLNDGDELIVGSVTFRVHVSGAEGGAATEPTARGPIPQGVDPETGLQFLEPVDMLETVPVEQFAATQEPVAESVVADAAAVRIPTAEPVPVAEPDEESPILVPDEDPAATQSDVAFDLTEEEAPGNDDSALGSFLRRL